QAVEERGFAGIGVANDGHRRVRHALATGAMQRSRLHHAGEGPADALDALLDQPSVGLDLGLTGAAEEAEAAPLAVEVGPGRHEAALLIVEVRKFYLQSALTGQCPLAEDLQDQPSSVEHFAVPRPLEIALLDRTHGLVARD